MANAPTAAGLEARLRAEFRADWSDRKKALDLAIQQSSSALARDGHGRSSALVRKHGELLEQALEDAQAILIRRAAALLSDLKRIDDALPRLREAIGDEMTQLANGFVDLLAQEASNIGLGAPLTDDLQIKRKALATRLESDLGNAATATRRAAIPPVRPWYERPLGVVGLAATAILLAWLVTDKACAK